MIHPLIEASEVSRSDLNALNAALERVCRELQLSTRPDPLTDIVAETVRRGKTDPAHVLECAHRARKSEAKYAPRPVFRDAVDRQLVRPQPQSFLYKPILWATLVTAASIARFASRG